MFFFFKETITVQNLYHPSKRYAICKLHKRINKSISENFQFQINDAYAEIWAFILS